MTAARAKTLRHWRKLRARAAYAPKGSKVKLLAALKGFVTKTLRKEIVRG